MHYWLKSLRLVMSFFFFFAYCHQDSGHFLLGQVFYYLGELNDSLSYALGAGPLFDVSEDSDYAHTLLGEHYILAVIIFILFLVTFHMLYSFKLVCTYNSQSNRRICKPKIKICQT